MFPLAGIIVEGNEKFDEEEGKLKILGEKYQLFKNLNKKLSYIYVN